MKKSDKNDNPYFDQVASQWDCMRKGFFSEAVREAAFRHAGLVPGQRGADIGAGTGFVTEGLLREGLQVIAVDQSDAMLQVLNEKFGQSDALECRVGEAESLPIDESTMDFVFANMYLHHVQDPPAAIGEMTRILKKGGKLLLTDLVKHPFHFLREEHHDRWMGFSMDEVETWFSHAGLIGINARSMGEECCSDSCATEQSAKISIFLASGVKA